ncbi:HNH endonuclease [Candidatus Desulfarcum epimagneticum]|uniref:HNH endonuclease n=1 Tax=uncultured Desulfobacteraceae bacterium TaxID=218296 RepID=A0A484HEK3_9BACT|nr:HNH endonuclease [uncultured Desulfobacteraceae bacterium]
MKPEEIRKDLQRLIIHFEDELKSDDLRKKVLALVPCFHQLRELGKSLIPRDIARSARDRILLYFLKYPKTIIKGDELLVVGGIQEYARRVRELKVQFGWFIVSGVTANQMNQENEFPIKNMDVATMGPSDYVMLSTRQDRDAAHRWHLANEIRRESLSARDKILKFLRQNVGQKVTGEELRYVAKDKTEWARRARELRAEYGWPVVTRNTGRLDLDVGVYLLEADRQSPEHDRRIPDPVKRGVLRRDGYKCKNCGWSHDEWNRSDLRHLELHHVRHHASGGENTQENLITLCTVCHDDVHRKQ